MHRIWKEFAKNHPDKFDKELKIKTDFAVRTWISSAFYSFFITNTNLQIEYVIRESCGTHRFSLTLALLLQLELESTPCLSAFVISPSGRR